MSIEKNIYIDNNILKIFFFRNLYVNKIDNKIDWNKILLKNNYSFMIKPKVSYLRIINDHQTRSL